ncbi:LPXTG cell wall anchor domain-containing protein, partial [Limosilactobacillus fermentum]
ESAASSSGAATNSTKEGRPVNAGTVDQVLANILGKKAASSSSAPADERSGDHQALKRGGASSTNTPQRQLPQTGNQGTGLTIAGLGLFAMVGSALKRSWVSQKV